MTLGQARQRGPRGYHHGNLKEALIRAALELIAREGPGRLHLRRSGALGRRQPGRALSAFPRPRRAAGRRRAARLRAFRRRARDAPGTTASPIRSTAFERLGKAYLDFARASRPIIRRCSRPAFRSTPIPTCARRASAPSACCAAPPKRLIAQHAGRRAAAGADGGAACLVAVARHRVAVRARRCGAAHACRCRRRNCWRRRADLSARPRPSGRRQ